MKVEFSDLTIKNIDKIELSLTSKRMLKADVLDRNGKNLFGKSISMTDLNRLLNAIYSLNNTKTIDSLISSGVIHMNKEVMTEYTWDDNSFSKVRVLNEEKVANLNIDTIDYLDVSLKGDSINTVVMFLDGSYVKLEDTKSINALLNLFYTKGKTLPELMSAKKLSISPNVFKDYELIDNKYFSMRKIDEVDTIKNLEFDVNSEGNTICRVIYKDGTVKPITEISEMTNMINSLRAKYSKSLSELIAAGLIVCTDDFNNIYELAPNDKFVLKTRRVVDSEPVAHEDEPVAHEEEPITNDGSIIVDGEPVLSDEEKEEKKKRRKRAIIITGASLATIASLIAWYVLDRNSGLTDNREYNPDPNKQNEENVLPTTDPQYTHNLGTDEEIINGLRQDTGTVYEDRYAQEESVLGNSLDLEIQGMQSQLETIDSLVLRNELVLFENFVVADDYDAVYNVNCMRNNVLNGTCDALEFVNVLNDYISGKDNFVNGNFIEPFDSLKPYAKYIVVRITQGVMQMHSDFFQSIGYDFSKYDQIGSDLYATLTENRLIY